MLWPGGIVEILADPLRFTTGLLPLNYLSETGPPITGLIGTSPAMERVYRMIRQVARSNASVLLLGESGTGKELLANAVHRLSFRSGGPFVRVNCGALSESLLESELFGHVRGAFTGAVANRTGRFEAAHGGTIFLDEINSTTPHLQVKLLRVLQEREFERVGDTQTVRVDTRLIAASNRDLRQEVMDGHFREDLFWRLNVVPISLPPLRERREDIPALVGHFLKHYNELNDRLVVHIQRDALQLMQDYDWPGNVRELQNAIERAVVLAEGDELSVGLLPEHIQGSIDPAFGGDPSVSPLERLTRDVVAQGLRLPGSDGRGVHAQIVDAVERELILQVMRQCQQIQTKAAARLGMNRNTLHKKLKQYGLEESDAESDE